MRTDAEKAAAAKALHDRQRHYDRLHHMQRLVWLGEPSPTWGDGRPVLAHELQYLTNGSNRCLELINTHGMSTNSVDLGDLPYLVELDKFASTQNVMELAQEQQGE